MLSVLLQKAESANSYRHTDYFSKKIIPLIKIKGILHLFIKKRSEQEIV
ncbi:hypothetical protein BN1221_04241c [Brenneria goodwinii]|uniref:Uncharacterized protein n=1 Tax=Brenneria goodwinii TaxID=1109412 RepID=A0A0G4K1E1_9GAMM|nr:hypothetical protein BN1221_04241c [Brenneria goodwinii]